MEKLQNNIMYLLTMIEQSNINYFVYTKTVQNNGFIKNILQNPNKKAFLIDDPRCAGYFASGIAEESTQPVIIVLSGDNEYRSLMPSITEANYRGLKIIVITFSNTIRLRNDRRIKDTFSSFYQISLQNSLEEIHSIWTKSIQEDIGPVHIDVDLLNDAKNQSSYEKIDVTKLIDKIFMYCKDNSYIFIGTDFYYTPFVKEKDVKIVHPDFYDSEGVLSNVLGASLNNTKQKYIGIASESEFIHDLNVLGNRQITSKIVFFVFIKKYEKLILNYAKYSNFEIYEEHNLSNALLTLNKPSIVIIK